MEQPTVNNKQNNWIAITIGVVILVLITLAIGGKRKLNPYWPYPANDPFMKPVSTQFSPGDYWAPYIKNNSLKGNQNTFQNNIQASLVPFTAPDGSFAVSLPQNYSQKTNQIPVPSSSLSVSQMTYSGTSGTNYYAVSDLTFPDSIPMPSATTLLQKTVTTLQSSQSQYVLQSQNSTMFQSYPAITYQFYNSSKNYYLKGVSFVVNKKEYSLIEGSPTADPSDYNTFTNSFKLQ